MALAVGRVLSGDKTSDKTVFYEIIRTEKGQLTLESRWTADSQMLGGYTCLMVIESGGKQYLVGYSREKSEADAYEILLEKPYFSSVESRLSFDPGWDSLEPFFLGNRQYITCYKRTTGQFNFFEVNEDLSLSKPFRFIHSREPGTSIGFTMVKPIVCLGMVYIMGYNFETGNAVIYSLNVTSRSSSPDVPPLNLKYVWQRSWSPGWTRFAFLLSGVKISS